jgi:ssDNA-binding Zn-finger/Zn-ribbon topoisomerase 1
MDYVSLLFFVGVGLVFWFLFKRTQLKREREQREDALRTTKSWEEALPADETERRKVLAFREKGYFALWELAKNDPKLQAAYAPKAEAARQKHGNKARPCPQCGAAADKLEWFYFNIQGNHGWMTDCPQCNLQVDFFAEREEGQTELWERLKDDAKFQAAYTSRAGAARQKYGDKAHACPNCGLAAAKLEWFYFVTPTSYWQARAGSAGWMTACQHCNVQVDFFIEVMN